MNTDNAPDQDFDPSIPSAQEMLQRLQEVDLDYFDHDQVFVELKGKQIWVSAMTIPVSVVILAIFTLIGTFAFDSPIISFAIAAALLFWIARMIDAKDNELRFYAHQEVIRRIGETEGEFGLVPHFKHFLPTRYRHLWQSLKKGNYQYIEQYLQAIHLLQTKLEHNKFIRIWELKYPQFLPPQDQEELQEPLANPNPSKNKHP